MKAQTIAYICNHRDGRVKIFMEEPASPMWESAELVSRHDADAELETLKAENARLTDALQWEQNRADRIGTHGDGCWKWGPSHYECALREIDRLTALLEPKDTALSRFTDADVRSELNPIERLRFFCLLAMNDQDWLDVEPFIDAVTALFTPQKVLTAAEVTEPGLYWTRGCSDTEYCLVNVFMDSGGLVESPYGTDQSFTLRGRYIGPIKMPEMK